MIHYNRIMNKYVDHVRLAYRNGRRAGPDEHYLLTADLHEIKILLYTSTWVPAHRRSRTPGSPLHLTWTQRHRFIFSDRYRMIQPRKGLRLSETRLLWNWKQRTHVCTLVAKVFSPCIRRSLYEGWFILRDPRSSDGITSPYSFFGSASTYRE